MNTIQETGSTKNAAKNFNNNLMEMLKRKYGQIKTDILEASEELKMRRVSRTLIKHYHEDLAPESLDKENELRINSLITEMFELKRLKDEEISTLKKSNDSFKQEAMLVQQEFDKKTKMHEEDKVAQSMSIISNSKGIKSLKDEVLALQLTKYSLEKKLKEQEHQLQSEKRSKENIEEKMKELISVQEGVKVQCSEMKTRLGYLSDLVLKTDTAHQRLAEVNEHHRCLITNYQSTNRVLQSELTTVKAELVLVKDDVKTQSHATEATKFEGKEDVIQQLEKELKSTRQQKNFLMVSLTESNHLLSTAQEKLNAIQQTNGELQFELDDLKSSRKLADDLRAVREKEFEGLKERLAKEAKNEGRLEMAFQEKSKQYETRISTLECMVENIQETQTTDQISPIEDKNEDQNNLSSSCNLETADQCTDMSTQNADMGDIVKEPMETDSAPMKNTDQNELLKTMELILNADQINEETAKSSSKNVCVSEEELRSPIKEERKLNEESEM